MSEGIVLVVFFVAPSRGACWRVGADRIRGGSFRVALFVSSGTSVNMACWRSLLWTDRERVCTKYVSIIRVMAWTLR